MARHPASIWENGATRDNNAYAWTGHYATTRGYTTNGLNQYSAAGGTSLSYDANGNLTASGSSAYVYDIENRLVGATGGVVLSYDPLGRLYQVSSTAGPTTTFLYDGDALVTEYVSATMTRRYVHNVGADVPLLSYAGSNLNTPSYLHADERGSIVAISDASGNGTINTYDEYGIPGPGNTGRFQYTGQAWLPELGMYYYKARIYSPTLGRFMQTDPIGYEDQYNLYAYVGNDPMNRTDPTGQYECKTEAACKAAGQGINEIRAARNFYRSAAVGSRLARSPSAARAVDKVLSSLGQRDDGGVNIATGNLPGLQRGSYDDDTKTITLDTAEIRRSGARIGEILGHETQHYRLRNEDLGRISGEIRPLAMQYIIGIVPGGSISPTGAREYIRGRVNSRAYCNFPRPLCTPVVEGAMNDELQKPF